MYRQIWPQNWIEPFASSSRVLGLQMYTTMPAQLLIISIQLEVSHCFFCYVITINYFLYKIVDGFYTGITKLLFPFIKEVCTQSHKVSPCSIFYYLLKSHPWMRTLANPTWKSINYYLINTVFWSFTYTALRETNYKSTRGSLPC